ncbi:Amylo-alpha-1,6-glucosidase, partial [Cardiosporidium cionae]
PLISLYYLQHMLKESRKVRPTIWIYAELFTGDRQMDLFYERELGINALIREAMQTYSPRDLGGLVVQYGGGKVSGSLERIISSLRNKINPMKSLIPSLCPALLFDCTHDNEPPA